MLLRLVAVMALLGMAHSVQGLESATNRAPNRWATMPDQTSANLSGTHWQLAGTAGLSWVDGRQAIVTFWSSPGKKPSTIRCTAYFDKDMVESGEKCEEPAS